MTLALEAGRLDVDRWMEEQGITSEQFDEWVEFDQIRVDLEKIALENAMGYAAILNRLKLICESSLVGYKNVPDAKPTDFIFWQKSPAKKKPRRKESGYVSPNAGLLAVRAAIAAGG